MLAVLGVSKLMSCAGSVGCFKTDVACWQCWVFRYGGRYLLPRKTITNGLDEGDSYSLMVLEQTPSYSQRIYLAGGSSVAVNLSAFNPHIKLHYFGITF